nr:HAMP domain-containing sensor histidine kinase [Ammoniphilus resinae]
MVDQDIDHSIELYAFHEEFRQVLVNIILNSLDALSECDEKSIRIKGYIDGDSIHISIANNGPMIPQDKIQTIFEPFFSTKKLGTGIGLYVCKKIIEQHNGTIHCESDKDWTTFHIILPKGCES